MPAQPQPEAALKSSEENTIPPHPTLTLHATTLTLTLDFTPSTYPSTFWTGEKFIPFRSTRLSTLPLYLSQTKITKLIIHLNFPHHRTQSNALRLTHRDLVSRIAGLLSHLPSTTNANANTNANLEIEISFQSPETEWCQVRCLAPFWGVRGVRVRVKEGVGEGGKVVVVGRGSELDGRLRGEWRRMREGWELY
jgi:hypothetical protein